MAIVLLNISTTLGCDTSKRIFDAFDSTRDTGLTIDRIWDIREPERKFLIVMVHGFNSSSEAAWGGFASLIRGEKNSTFADFNVIRYGYGTSVCRNRVEISVRGDGLRSFLIDEMKNYRGIIFVGHSMGGLVVMHALTILARDNSEDLNRLPVIAMTFGTPHLGVQGADALAQISFLCRDKQAGAMEAFSEELVGLTAQWDSYFGNLGGDRYNYHVAMKRYYGGDDLLVSHASACAGRISECEQVDGNHAWMVKPNGPDHLAYQKLRAQVSNLVIARDNMLPMSPSNLRIEKN